MATLPIFACELRAPLRCLGPHEKQIKGYPDFPATLGQHLRKRRLDLRQTQEQCATQFGICMEAYNHWENDRGTPVIKHWPAIISFLGHDPNPPPEDFREALGALQRRHGLPKEELARRLGLDMKTLFNWLSGRTIPHTRALNKLLSSQLPGTELLAPFVSSLAGL